ncbi:hypothetical protein BJY04DRAFT_64100 [Aspergillus karnatakaensis]|uniref:HNH endonuclease signature motif containing protein n=1 Tax=Aspergillus karnatakaensis TaxID=1810916 RepID=UPI003CCCE95C
MEHSETEPFPELMDTENTELFQNIHEDAHITSDTPSRRATILSGTFDENFGERSPQRSTVLRKLEVILDSPIPVPFWAFCQVADVDIIEGLIRQFAAAPDLAPFAIQSCFVVPRLWAQKPPRFSEKTSVSSSDASSRSAGRSQRLAALARERDGGICVISGSAPCDVAHIFAHYLLKPKTKQTASEMCVPNIWSVLSLFWSPEQIRKWRHAIFQDDSPSAAGTDGVFNLICLRPDLQRAWAQGLFALRPTNLSDDMKSMDLEFHWLPRYQHKFDATISIAEQPLSTRNLNKVDDCFIFRDSGHKIVSGSIIKLTTSDPVRIPLPSYDLLELAWHLARIISMSASGLYSDIDIRFDGDDDAMQPVPVPKRIMDWLLPQSPSPYASSIEQKESPMTSTNSSPVKTRNTDKVSMDATPMVETLSIHD